MIIGIHPDKLLKQSYSDIWIKCLKEMDIEVKLLDLLNFDILTQVKECDGIMWRWNHVPINKISAQKILFTIEHCLKIPIFPNSATSWHYDDKIAQFYLLNYLNVPMPKTWIFWNAEEARKWIISTNYPLVVKLSTGASSSNVFMIHNQKEAETFIDLMFNKGIFPNNTHELGKIHPSFNQIFEMIYRSNGALKYFFSGQYPNLPATWWKPEYGYIYFQEFVPNNSFDTRVTIIGNRAFAFRRMNRKNDFRASGSGDIDYDIDKINLKCIQMAFEISKKENFQSMAYDFLMKNGQPVICEISYTFADYAVKNCPGYWNSDLKWVDDAIWPEKAQVEDFIHSIKKMEKK